MTDSRSLNIQQRRTVDVGQHIDAWGKNLFTAVIHAERRFP